jgi:hypothetical protein
MKDDEVIRLEGRGSLSGADSQPGADRFMDECRELAVRINPDMATMPQPYLVQAIASLAVQRIMQWASRNTDLCENPETVPSHAIIGALTALGIGATMFDYDIDDVLAKARLVMRAAATDTRQAMADELRGQKGPWDA